MNMLNLKTVALGLALTATAFVANAQKSYTKGLVTYNINANGQDIEANCYFTPDSTTFGYSAGPYSLKMISTTKDDYFAVLVEVPVISRKAAAVLTPGEIEELGDAKPAYTFTSTSETKKIGDYNCIKYIAKDAQSGSTSDVWVTTDISLPPTIITKAFASIKGVPVEFAYFAPGTKVAQIVTIKSISDAKAPAGTFSIPSDFTRISYADMKAMSGRRQ